jgi:hypothetical protein
MSKPLFDGQSLQKHRTGYGSKANATEIGQKKKNLDCQFKVGVQNKAIQTKSKGAKILSKWQSCH